MNKDDKPVERELAHGSVVPNELIEFMGQAANNASYMSVRVNWTDGHSSRISDIGELAPIEDAEHIANVGARFSYADGSELDISLRNYTAHTVSATGQTARTRQSALCEYWATLPGRSRISAKHFSWLSKLTMYFQIAIAVICVAALFRPEIRTSGVAAPLLLSLALIGWCAHLFVRSLIAARAIGHLVVLHRRSRVDVSKIVSAVTGIAGLALAVVAYLYPRK